MPRPNVSTHQFEPLRVPSEWGVEERKLVLQLGDTFQDLYRRFNRLRLEDLGPEFRKGYTDLNGNVSQLLLTAETFQLNFDRIDADFVQNSAFELYQSSASAQMQATATAVVQSYELEAQFGAVDASLEALTAYNTHTQQYIRTGLLFFEDGVPRYGVAIGESFTTVEVNGELVLERAGLAATLTSSEIAFWQNALKVAYLNNSQLNIREAVIEKNLYMARWVLDPTYGLAMKYAA